MIRHRAARRLSIALILALAAPIAPGASPLPNRPTATGLPIPPRGLGAIASDLPESRPPKASGAELFLGGAPDVQVNVDVGNAIDEFGPAVAAGPAGAVYAVWVGDETQKSVWFSRSTDGGDSFGPAVRVNDSVAYPPSFSVFQPDVLVDPSGVIYVAWFDYRAWADDASFNSRIDVYVDRSADGGVTWGTDVLASVGGAGDFPWHFQPYLARANDGTLFVAFNDLDRFSPEGDAGDVSVARSLDGGASWQPKVRVDDLGTGTAAQSWPAIAASPSSNDLYVAFEDLRGAGMDIRIARSTDGGASFGPNLPVHADTTGRQEEPSVAVDGLGRVGVACFDWRTDSDPVNAPDLNHVTFTRSPAGAASFGAVTQVTDEFMKASFGFNFPPRLAMESGGEIHVVWHDRRLGRSFCYYDHSTDGGLSFGPDRILHEDHGILTHALPRIALQGGNQPTAVWQDRRNGNGRFDIFAAHEAAVTGVSPGVTRLPEPVVAAPNPFATLTHVRFSLAHPDRVSLEICDLQGRRIRTLIQERLPAGEHTASWRGEDASGRPVATGVYLVRLRVSEGTRSSRVMRLK